MRLALIGSRSFIARHVSRVAQTAGIEVLPLSHESDLVFALQNVDVAVNFALHPSLKSEPYAESHDFDLKAAVAAARNGARFVMLSTRRVYPNATRWGAKENSDAAGDETFYGRNKALSEAAARSATRGNLAILRLSNIIGFEYEPDRPRNTFMGMVLQRLRADRKISFDMNPDTERDFLPVEACAAAVVRIATSGTPGVFNMGCGFGVRCGDVANAVMKGFGEGELVVTNKELRDPFFLDMSLWNSSFPPPLVDIAQLLEYCEDLGRRLTHA